MCAYAFKSHIPSLVRPFHVYVCLFTAYWGRDPNAAAAAAAANPLFGTPFGAAAAAGLGMIPGATSNANDRYSMSHQQQQQHQQNTMSVAASQAASLAGLHPASEYLFCSIN